MKATNILVALETIMTAFVIWFRRDAAQFQEQDDLDSYATYTSAAERLEKASELVGVAINILAKSQ